MQQDNGLFVPVSQVMTGTSGRLLSLLHFDDRITMRFVVARDNMAPLVIGNHIQFKIGLLRTKVLWNYRCVIRRHITSGDGVCFVMHLEITHSEY